MLTKYLNSSAARFLTVGSATFLCEYIVFYILYVSFEWQLLIANSLSFIVGLCLSFTLNRVWAFKRQNYQRKLHHQAAIYILLALSNLIFNNLIVSGLKAAGIDPRIGKIIAIAIIAIWNFLLYKHLIFKEKLQKAE